MLGYSESWLGWLAGHNAEVACWFWEPEVEGSIPSVLMSSASLTVAVELFVLGVLSLLQSCFVDGSLLE